MQNKTITLLVVTAIFSWLMSAESWAGTEPSYKYIRNYYTYTVNPDGSNTAEIDYGLTVLKEDALNNTKKQDISYSTSVEQADVIEAYTQKANGQRIDVPKTNFQLEVNSGKDNAAPAFSDWSELTVIFPDLAVGDTVFLKYKITQKEALFPNQFSNAYSFPKSTIYEDVRVKMDLPDSMPVQYEISGMAEKKPMQKNGRKIFEWSLQNKKAVEDDPKDWGDVYRFGKDPGYMISTFPSYAAITAAYGVRAKQQAVVTERIQKLADDITKGKNNSYGQAKALYEWVASKISFAGNCIGVGAVVPRDTNFVLDNHMGDCKDHATLLEALLAAKKIPSTQALINVGSLYSLPKIPVVSLVNHVINYIPSLKIYADATAEGTPFGFLPDSETGKPILLVDGYQDGLKTPAISHSDEKITVNSNVKIAADGSAKGSVKWIKQGRPGVFANDKGMLKKFLEFKRDKERVEEYSKAMVKKSGFDGGKVNYSLDEHPQSPDIAMVDMTFDVKGFTHAGAGAFYISPLFSSSFIYSTLNSTKMTEVPSHDFNCRGGHYEENYVYEFPKAIKILAVPDNISFGNNLVSYQASYVQKENTVTVKRQYDDLTAGPVCEPKIYQAYKELANKVMADMNSQIVYK